MKLFIKSLIIVCIALFVRITSVVAVEIDQIRSYDTNVVIKKDGSIAVTERILYDFSENRHGIYRNIPYIKMNSEGKRLKVLYENIRVTDEKDLPYTYKISNVNDALSLQIGDANKTIIGEHVYVISYDVNGALTFFSGHDELYWNAIGPDWNISSLHASATVTLPQEFEGKQIQTNCFIGSLGSFEKLCTETVKGTSIFYESTRPLAPNEGMTIVAGFPKGIITELNAKEIIPFINTREGKIVVVLLGIIVFVYYVLAPIIVIRKWWISGRDPKPLIGEAIAWYSPPKTKEGRELTPAETGTLIDEVVDHKDVFGSVVDLARRGYFQIIEVSKNKFELEKHREKIDGVLQPFEEKILNILFATKERVALKEVNLYEQLGVINSLIYAHMVEDGFFPTNPETIRKKYVALSIFSLIFFNPVLFITAWIFGMSMPKKTQFGSSQKAISQSLKNFLKSQSKHLTFQAKEKFMFEKLLPYAIVFGVEEIWAKRFKDFKMTPPEWYVSSTPNGRFSSIMFVQGLHSSYTMSFQSSIQYKSSTGFTSGFSSSGGFSGGGGGGGGGGSW